MEGRAEWETLSLLVRRDSHSPLYLGLTLEYGIGKGRILGHELVKARPQLHWDLDSPTFPSFVINFFKQSTAVRSCLRGKGSGEKKKNSCLEQWLLTFLTVTPKRYILFPDSAHAHTCRIEPRLSHDPYVQ